jgi:very-short-patch-repair endonuclease
MPRPVAVPRELTFAPFVGRDTVAAGLVTRAQLAGPAWRRLLPDIYAWAQLGLDHRAWCLAAGLFLRDRGAVSGRAAAALWGADVLVRGDPIEVTVPVSTRLRAPAGLTVVRSPLPAEDVGRWAGIPVTTPKRTAFDVARRLPLIEAVVAVDAMLAARLISRSTLTALIRDEPYWPGLPQLRKVLMLCDPGAESPMETRLRLILIAGRLPWPVTQYEVRDSTGLFVARLDLAYPKWKLGIEYEGDHHRGRGMFQRDLRRINALRACGWTVLRFAALDIYREPKKIITTVSAALQC